MRCTTRTISPKKPVYRGGMYQNIIGLFKDMNFKNNRFTSDRPAKDFASDLPIITLLLTNHEHFLFLWHSII